MNFAAIGRENNNIFKYDKRFIAQQKAAPNSACLRWMLQDAAAPCFENRRRRAGGIPVDCLQPPVTQWHARHEGLALEVNARRPLFSSIAWAGCGHDFHTASAWRRAVPKLQLMQLRQ